MSDMNAEYPISVVSLRPLPGLKTERIRQKDALDHQFVMRNLEPQLVYSEKDLGVYNVLSPYTEKGLHVMLLDTTPE